MNSLRYSFSRMKPAENALAHEQRRSVGRHSPYAEARTRPSIGAPILGAGRTATAFFEHVQRASEFRCSPATIPNSGSG
jgi:hypothetical protein